MMYIGICSVKLPILDWSDRWQGFCIDCVQSIVAI